MFTKRECQATGRILAGNLQDANIPAAGPATTEEPASRLPLPGQPVTRVIRRERRTSLTANPGCRRPAGERLRHAHAGAEILTMAAPVGAGGTPPAARGPWRRGRHRARKYPPLWHASVRKRGPSGATQIGDSVPSRISRGARALALAGRDCEAFGQPRRVSGCDMLGRPSVPGDANRCPAGPGRRWPRQLLAGTQKQVGACCDCCRGGRLFRRRAVWSWAAVADGPPDLALMVRNCLRCAGCSLSVMLVTDHVVAGGMLAAVPAGGPRCAAAEPVRQCQSVHSASVGDMRAARRAGSSPAAAPMSSAAPSPPAQASGGTTMAQPLVVA
jgi:hypothetical protein